MLGEIEAAGKRERERVVLADMEAGLGTLSRMQEGHVDHVLVVADATPKALEVARRAVEMARGHNVGRALVVANRIRTTADLDMVRQALPNEQVIVVPDDRAVEDADRIGVAPIDYAPDSAAVAAISDLVETLLGSQA